MRVLKIWSSIRLFPKGFSVDRYHFAFALASKAEPYWWHENESGDIVRDVFAIQSSLRESGQLTALIIGKFHASLVVEPKPLDPENT